MKKFAATSSVDAPPHICFTIKQFQDLRRLVCVFLLLVGLIAALTFSQHVQAQTSPNLAGTWNMSITAWTSVHNLTITQCDAAPSEDPVCTTSPYELPLNPVPWSFSGPLEVEQSGNSLFYADDNVACGSSLDICEDTLSGSISGNSVSLIFQRKIIFTPAPSNYSIQTHHIEGELVSETVIEGLDEPFELESHSKFTDRFNHVITTDIIGTHAPGRVEIIVPATDLNEAPTDITLNPNSMEENQPVGAIVGTFSSVDPDTDDTFTYSLVSGVGDTDNRFFSIVGDQLQTNEEFDFETKNSYSIRVRSTDSGDLSVEKNIIVTVTDINEAPTDIGLSPTTVVEKQPEGTTVGTFSTVDPDLADSFTYSLASGAGSADNGSFSIVGDQLQTNDEFDFETKNSYSIRVRSTDSGGLSVEKKFIVTVISLFEIVKDSVTPKSIVTLDGPFLRADFKPNLSLSLSEAAQLLGYDHFNWLNIITDNPILDPQFRDLVVKTDSEGKPVTVADELDEAYGLNTLPVVPYFDPALGGWKYQKKRGIFEDNLQWYLTEPTELENFSEDTNGDGAKDTLHFSDGPNRPWPFTAEYWTALVGVFEDGRGVIIPGTIFEWKYLPDEGGQIFIAESLNPNMDTSGTTQVLVHVCGNRFLVFGVQFAKYPVQTNSSGYKNR